MHQIIVKVDGWETLYPLSVDKVGTYYRNTVSDVMKPSIFNRVRHYPHSVEIICLFYSSLKYYNFTSYTICIVLDTVVPFR
mgnify:FL=1